MKPTIITLLTLIIFSGWTIKDAEKDNTYLLTAGSSKVWQIAQSTPEQELNSCQPMGPVMLDNTWTFYEDGKFEFDHGSITEDPDCTYEGCCTDLVNITGRWEFTDNGRGIRIIMQHETGNPSNTFNEEWYNAEIEILEKGRFRFSQVEGGTKYSFEFRAKG